MLKPPAQTHQSPATTKERIVIAALETLKEEGFAGTSARAIARRGNFNQALIFYHFGTLNDLLLAALDRTSADRMARYREAVRRPGTTIEDRIRMATDLYREDLQTGHITVISELIAGSLARPDLGPEVVARMEPWVELVEDELSGLLAGSLLGSLVGGVIQPRPLAFGIIALYLGVDLLSHLDHDHSRAAALFETAGRLAPMLAPLLGELPREPQEPQAPAGGGA
ncbi:MAG TPA: TetR family transcriptional regulator [Actinomycetota bacterium]|nr:TetR family transcriptional regulator [Actinomycetota bacterium]